MIRARRRPPAWLAGVAVLLVAVVLAIALGAAWPMAAGLAAVGLAIGAGAAQKLREERSAHQSALNEWTASRAVLTERLAIARDLHDLVSNGLGLITVRAAAAKHVNAVEPHAGDLLEALDDVEAISRQATEELRRMLRTLRESDDAAPLRPADTLDAVPEIAEAARRVGLAVEVRAAGLPRVPAVVQVAICAVIREGLANTARHAGPTDVQVNISHKQHAVTVSVIDAGPAGHWHAAPGSGHGLLGLRERMTSLGGFLDAGPHGAGYRLEATFPDGPQ